MSRWPARQACSSANGHANELAARLVPCMQAQRRRLARASTALSASSLWVSCGTHRARRIAPPATSGLAFKARRCSPARPRYAHRLNATRTLAKTAPELTRGQHQLAAACSAQSRELSPRLETLLSAASCPKLRPWPLTTSVVLHAAVVSRARSPEYMQHGRLHLARPIRAGPSCTHARHRAAVNALEPRQPRRASARCARSNLQIAMARANL